MLRSFQIVQHAEQNPFGCIETFLILSLYLVHQWTMLVLPISLPFQQWWQFCDSANQALSAKLNNSVNRGCFLASFLVSVKTEIGEDVPGKPPILPR
eukprot:6210677-Pleurochrysis_carterae.AAC.1